MFQYGFDECATNAPPWYAQVDKAIEKENFDEAARIAREAMLTAENAQDVEAQVIALNSYLKVLIGKGDVFNGQKFSQKAMELAATTKTKNLEAMATHMAAKVAIKDRKAADAKKLAGEAKKLYDTANNSKGSASVLITMAKAHISKKETEEALTCLSTALESLKAIDEERGIIAALYAAYELKMKEDMIYPAIQTMEEISEKLQALGDLSGQGSAEFASAEIHFSQGNLADAMRCSGMAAELFDMAVDIKKKGASVFLMATVFRAGDQLADAEEAVTVSLQCFKAARQKAGQAGALVMLGQLFVVKGPQKLADAAHKFEEAAFLYRQMKDYKLEADALGQLCAVQVTMVEMGAARVTEPIRHGRRAVILFEDNGMLNTDINGKTQMVLAQALLIEKEELDESIAAIEVAIKIFAEIDDRLSEAKATELAAKIQFAMKDKSAGVETAQKALDIYQELGDSAGVTAAEALVESQGKPKTGAVRQLTWMDIFWGPKMYCQFFEFEARAARYSAASMAGGGDASSSSGAMGGFDPSGTSAPRSGKVQYAIRWQRAAHIDMLAQGDKIA